jgi:hypothetical protein
MKTGTWEKKNDVWEGKGGAWEKKVIACVIKGETL